MEAQIYITFCSGQLNGISCVSSNDQRKQLNSTGPW